MPYCFGVCLFSVESGSENWAECHGHHAVVIEPILRRQSPENGNIRGTTPETFAGFRLQPAKSGAQRRDTEWQRPAIGGPFFRYWGHSAGTPDYLADLEGFEPAHSHLRNAL